MAIPAGFGANSWPMLAGLKPFLGEANLLPVSGGRVVGFRHQATPTLPEGTALVRPEYIVLLPAARGDAVPGRVELTVF